MHRQVHMGGMGRANPAVQLFLGVDRDAVVVRLVQVAVNHLRRLGPQGAVLEQLAGAGAEEALPVGRIAAHRLEPLKVLGLHQALLVDPHRQFSVRLHLPEDADQADRVHSGNGLQIVGVDAGNARRVQIPLAQPDQLLYIGVIRLGEHLHIQAGGILPQDAVGKVHQGQHLGRHILQRADALQHYGVAGPDVQAGPQHTHRDIGGDAVQILPRHQAPLHHGLLIPAHADQVGWVVPLNPGPPPFYDLPDGCHAKQGEVFLNHGVVEQVHVGIGEAGQHHASLQIPRLIPHLRQSLLNAPQKGQSAVLRAHRLIAAHGAVHRGNRSVVPKSPHISLPFRLRQVSCT